MPHVLFTIGPVGGFIGEARRTRDWWAGSFLLSWLMARALAPLQDRQILTRGSRDDPFLAALRTRQPADYTATLSNKVRLDIPDSEADALRPRILGAWQGLAQAVFDEFLAPAGVDPTIWDSQIGDDTACFWETYWVAGPETGPESGPGSGPVDQLDNRMAVQKRDRSAAFRGDVGPGDRCSLMPGFREISGLTRFGDRAAQATFWEAVRTQVARVEAGVAEGIDFDRETLNLRRDERLCAPALVKRLFPLLAPETLTDVIGCPPKGTDLWRRRMAGWGAAADRDGRMNVRFYPSTTAIAAYHWIRALESHGGTQAQAVVDTGPSGDVPRALRLAERQSRLWEPVLYDGDALRAGKLQKLAALDGRLFYTAADRPVPEGVGASFVARLKAAKAQLRRSARLRGAPYPTEPSDYYAVLQVDGDKVGTHLNKAGDRRAQIAQALTAFAQDVRGDGSGRFAYPGVTGEWLYANADEVRAVLPVDDAMAALRALHKNWTRRMPEDGPTLSGAVVFARSDLPLSAVMRGSDEALQKAKAAGRNRVALRILDFAGTTDSLVLSWSRALPDGTRLLDYLHDAQDDSTPEIDVFASNRGLHDMARILQENDQRTPGDQTPYAPDTFAAGQTEGLAQAAKAVARQILPRSDAKTVSRHADAAAALLVSDFDQQEILALDGLKILRLLRKERRRLPDV